MTAPLSAKQQRENYKFLFDELRKTVAARKEQRRKDQAHNQKMKQADDKHLQKMDVPPIMGKPMNPEAGPSDKIPALLTAGEAVIPKKAAQNPANKPLIKAMVREGRSDVNMSVPMPKGFMCGSTGVKGYAQGTEEVLDQYGQPVQQQQEIPMPVAQDFVTTYDPNAVAPVYEVPAPVAAVPTQGDNAFIARAESGSNPNIGYHYADGKSSAYGTYGITAGTYKDIQKADPYFKDKPITELSVEEQTKANNVLTGLNTTRLAKNDIEPTPANLRLSHFLGAEGAAEYLKSGKISDEAIKANGGTYEKAKAIADARLAGPVSQNRSVAERAIGVLTGSTAANAADTTTNNQGVLEVTKFNKPIGGDTVSNIKGMINKIIPQGNDISRIKAIGQAEPEVKPTAVPPQENKPVTTKVEVPPVVEYKPDSFNGQKQGAYAQQDRYIADIPKEGGTEQQQILRNQFKDPEKIKGSLEKYGDAITNTVSGWWETIKDPNKLGDAITGFVKDTLGFNGQDAARFGLLVAGSRALGYNPTQAIRYAGSYTLVASDKRAAAKALAENQMELAGAKKASDRETALINKGYVNVNGQWVYPPIKGQAKNFTVESGKDYGKNFELYEYKDARGNIDYKDANGKTRAQYAAEYGQPLVERTVAYTPEARDASLRSWEKDITSGFQTVTKRNFGDDTVKGQATMKALGIPTEQEASRQISNKLGKMGYDLLNPEMRSAAEDIASKSFNDMIRDKQAGVKDINTIEPYIEANLLIGDSGLRNDAFTTNKKTFMKANNISEQYNKVKQDVLTEIDPQARTNPQAVHRATVDKFNEYYREWTGAKTGPNDKRTVEERTRIANQLKQKYKGTDEQSGFYMYVNERL